MKKKPSLKTTAVLLLAMGFVVGISTISSQQAPGLSAVKTPADLTASALSPGSDSADESDDRYAAYDPGTKVYEPFSDCSTDYADGPGGDLDRKNMIGPENSVIVSPEEMKALGMSEATIRSQSAAWNELSPEEREEQLCRAAQERALID